MTLNLLKLRGFDETVHVTVFPSRVYHSHTAMFSRVHLDPRWLGLKQQNNLLQAVSPAMPSFEDHVPPRRPTQRTREEEISSSKVVSPVIGKRERTQRAAECVQGLFKAAGVLC